MPTSDQDAQEIARSHIELEERIRRRAHEIYEQRGGQPGSDLDDWLQAEKEILGESRGGTQNRGTVVGPAKASE